MTTALTTQAVRAFSAQATRPISRTSSAITTVLVSSAVVLPFVPPTLESVKERRLGHPNANRKHHVPLCRHP